jgi:hypothetical protein
LRPALLLALSAALAAPAHPDFRVTRTVTGVRLRIAGISAQQLTLFVAGGPGLRVFRHERLEPQRDGSFAVDLGLADPGLYMAFAEFVPQGGWPQMAQQAFTIGSAFAPRAAVPADDPHESNGLSAAIDLSQAKAGRESALAFELSEPVAGAPPELFIVSPDLTDAQHLTADSPSRGVHVVFAPIFPRAGRYKMWLIVQRSGAAATIPFVIDVPR